MRTIWKFPLPIADSSSVQMPKDARVISVAMQHHCICLWAVVDPFASREARTFLVFDTGHPIPSEGIEHVGSVLEASGALVWHVFEEAV